MAKPPPRDKTAEQVVKVGADLVRLVPITDRRGPWRAHFSYDILVNDTHRGWLSWCDSPRVRNRQWVIYGHLPPLVHYGISQLGQYREVATRLGSWREAAERVPALVAEGRLHTEPEARALLEAADREKAERSAAWARERAERDAAEAANRVAQGEALEAVQSIRLNCDALQLSNFEINGLEWLMANLPRLRQP